MLKMLKSPFGLLHYDCFTDCEQTFMSKMHRNTFGGRTPPEHGGGAYALPQTALAAIEGSYF